MAYTYSRQFDNESTIDEINKHCKQILKELRMHYRNGREAKNGDKIVKLEGGKVVAYGVLHSAIPGNDYCNGSIAPAQQIPTGACICDCLHVDDVAAMLKEKGLHKRPAGK